MKRLYVSSFVIVGVIAFAWWALIDRESITNPSRLESDFVEPAAEPGTEPLFTQRAFPNGSIDLAAVKQARLQMAQMRLRPGSANNPTWVQRGPNNIQGRVTAIAVDPTDDDIAYVGAAEGGIFRTFDGGNSWTALFDDKPSLSMGAVTLDPSDPNVVFAGTGEVNPGRGSVAYGGTGIYRSDDQGNNWTFIGLEDSGSIGRIVVHPTNPDIIHVAAMGHLWSPNPERGVYRTDDGGATWSRVLYVDDTTGCVDMIQRPDDPSVLYAAMWRRIRGPEAWNYGGDSCAVYRSDDGGLTWLIAGNGLPVSTADTGRIGLAICLSNPDVMCAIYSHATAGNFTGLYRTTDGGASWTQTNDGSLSNCFRTAGWWFGNVRIDPEDEDIIYVIGFDDYFSINGGDSYNLVGANMHVDHHAFAWGLGEGAKMYAGNDGGVYSSTDGVTFTKTTGDFPITQTYRVAAASWNTNALWLGTQDNGTSQDLNGDGNFDFIFGGDGFEPVPHLTDPNRIWVQYQFGNVFYSSDGGDSFSDARNGLSGRVNWNAPHAIDPGDPETRYFGTNKLFRNNGNTSWTAISGDLTGGSHQGNSGQVDGTLTTIGVSPADSQVIWTGSDDGYVHVTQNGGSNFTNVSAGLPVRWVTSVRPHPTTSGEALVTLSGFRWGEDVSHIYHTVDFGQTWTPADGDLPDMPVNDVLFDPQNTDRYFAATDIGVFETIDAGQTWTIFGNGLPNVVVNDLAYQDLTRELFAGTYGRSIFGITIPEVEPVVTPDTVTVNIGSVNSGGVAELTDSDDQYLVLDPVFLTFRYQLEYTVDATSPTDTPSALEFNYESRTSNFVGTVECEIELFDYVSGSFESVDSRLSSSTDIVVTVVTTGDPARFVQAGTGAMQARISYQNSLPFWVLSAQNLYLPYRVRADHVFWSITP